MTETSGDASLVISSPKLGAIPSRRAGIGRAHVMILVVAVAGLVWGAWMTRSILDLRGRPAPFVTVQLEGLVAEYVRAQARSAKSPDQIGTETTMFMKLLDASVARRARAGKVVLVSEAVVGGSVPDITGSVRREIYAHLPAPRLARNGGSATLTGDLEHRGGADGASR